MAGRLEGQRSEQRSGQALALCLQGQRAAARARVDGERHGQQGLASFVCKLGRQDLYACELWPGGNEGACPS